MLPKILNDKFETDYDKAALATERLEISYGYTWYNRNLFTDIELAIIDNLPHGSGIDYNWHIEKNTRGKVVCHNGYHFMNEHGYYMGTIDFSFRFDVNDVDSGRLMFHTTSSGRYWIDRLGLRDYLDEMLFSLLDEYIERECKYCSGAGKRSIAVLAEARQNSIEDTIIAIEKNGYSHDGTMLECWVCKGTGNLPV